MRSTGHNNAREAEPAQALLSAPTGAAFLSSAEFLNCALLEIEYI